MIALWKGAMENSENGYESHHKITSNKVAIIPYTKGKDVSEMIWGAFWVGGRSDIIIMKRDMTTKRQCHTANFYLEVRG